MLETTRSCFIIGSGCRRNAGYSVQGSINQPTINGHYTPSNHSENGFPVYTKLGLVLYWHGNNGGQWSIANAIGSGLRGIERWGTSPDGATGPSASGWKTWDGHQWTLESTIYVTGRKSCVAPHRWVFLRMVFFFGFNGFGGFMV